MFSDTLASISSLVDWRRERGSRAWDTGPHSRLGSFSQRRTVALETPSSPTISDTFFPSRCSRTARVLMSRE